MWYQPQRSGFIWPRNSSGGFTLNPPWAQSDCRRAMRWRSTAPWTFLTLISTTPSFGPRMARIWKNTNWMRSTTSKPSPMVSQVSFRLSGKAAACCCGRNANNANGDGRPFALQNQKRAAVGCWRVPLQAEHQRNGGGVAADHSQGGRWDSALWQLYLFFLLCSFFQHNSAWCAGLPAFVHQPQDRNVTRGAPFNLSCEAVGPPDPVRIRWLRDGMYNSDRAEDSPSSFFVSGESAVFAVLPFFLHSYVNMFLCVLLSKSDTFPSPCCASSSSGGIFSRLLVLVVIFLTRRQPKWPVRDSQYHTKSDTSGASDVMRGLSQRHEIHLISF